MFTFLRLMSVVQITIGLVITLFSIFFVPDFWYLLCGVAILVLGIYSLIMNFRNEKKYDDLNLRE
jgi:hypothetical protein